MFFLLRAAFWLGLVLILIPTGSSKTAPREPTIGAAEAASAASAAVADLSHFCTRQPDACAVGSHAATVLLHKAQASASMLYEFFTERRDGRDDRDDGDSRVVTGSLGGKGAKVIPAAWSHRSQDTLTAADRLPAWQAPAPHKAAHPPAVRRIAAVRHPG